VIASLARIRELPPAATARAAMVPWSLLGLAACDTAPAADGSPFVLTTRGDDVRSNAPRAIDVTLGSKLIRPADESDRFHGTLLHEAGLPFTGATG
jgi:hypothetical protein